MIMNAQQANHDPEWYGEDAGFFNPTRFMGNDNPLPHLTYGAGSRICPAVAISNRIMSALILRLVLAFEMKEVEGTRKPGVHMYVPCAMHFDVLLLILNRIDFSDVHTGLVAQPKFFDCSFKARDELWLKDIIAKPE